MTWCVGHLVELAQAAVYLAMAPKSNAVYSAWNAARELVRSDGTRPVPAHLRNAPTRLMQQLGHGAGYRYALLLPTREFEAAFANQ